MDDGKLPKQLLYGEQTRRERPLHKSSKQFKDILKSNLKALMIDVDHWETLIESYGSWRKIIKDKCRDLKQKCVKHATFKYALWKQDERAEPVNAQQELKCTTCSCFLLLRAGLINNFKSQQQKQNQAIHKDVSSLCLLKVHLSYVWFS